MNKLIVIIGAGPGLGFSVAKRFAKEGFDCVLIARNESTLKDMCGQISQNGVKPIIKQRMLPTKNSWLRCFPRLRRSMAHPTVWYITPELPRPILNICLPPNSLSTSRWMLPEHIRLSTAS